MASTRRRTEAGVRPRALAYLLDLCLVGGAVLAAAARLTRSRPARTLAVGLGGLVAGTLYHVALEGWRGRTVGKLLVGIAVVREDGTRCDYRAAAVRTALRVVDALPAAYLAGLLSIRLTERRQRLGDLAARTVVVRVRDPESADDRRR